MSMLDIYDMMKELGYVVPHEIFWQEPGDRLKVNLLITDNDVLTMLDSMPRNKYVHVYIKEVVEPIAETNLETGIEKNIFTRIDEETEHNIPAGIDDETDQNIETGIVDETEQNYEIGEDHYSVNVEEDSKGSEYVASDSEIEDSDNDLTDDELCDVDVEIGKDLPGFTVGLTVENEDDECDSKDSDSLHSADNSVTDDRRRRYHEFNSEVDLENPQFRKGLVFADQKIIKVAVREYGVRNRYNVRLKVNDSKRLQAVCKDGCPWMLWASRVSPKDSTNTSWQIKTYVGEHNCIRDVKNRNCTYRWVAKAYVDKFRVEPTYSTKSLRQDVATDHILQVPSSKCSRAKKLALEMIQGSHDEQYSRVYDYFAELGGCNPGTTTILQLDDRVFERMYICLQACKDGFKACRPIICLDGCFLKGHYQGWLLSAVGLDANDCVYPLAYAIVESENRSSWTWFLQILETDMELTNSNHYTFMSDKQKGLVDAIIDVFPYAEHRTCVRHLYSNFKLKNGNQGKALKDVLWKAARATYMKEFTDAMSEMRSMSDASFKWLQGKDPRQWSKSHFSTRCKSDMLLNNLSESFNKMILESRDKPILTMMEMIRSKIMTRIVSKKEQAEKINGLLCPKIQKKLESAIGQSIRCWPRAAGANKYEVYARPIDQHVVNLDNHSCSCRKWDLTGIPCMHAISVILMRQERPENYVSHYYSKDMQLQIYSNMVKPLRGPKQWANHGTNEPVIPPIIRRLVGRPQKNRKKEADEALTSTGRLGKTGVQMTCSKCGKTGHNKRSCKGQVGGNAPTSKVPRTKDAPTSNAPRRNIDPIPSVRIHKLSVKRPQTSNIQGPSQPTQTEGSQNTQGSIMTVRCMNSQPTQSSVNQTQSNTEALSKRPRWK
ncbi:hypothetical protein V6N13_027104 [Hibiscus sabdariffa]